MTQRSFSMALITAAALVVCIFFWNRADEENFAHSPTPNIIAMTTPTTARQPSFPAVLAPRYKTLLYAEVNLPIAKITKRMGDSFKKGDVLIQFKDESLKGNLKKAEAILEKAEAQFSGIKNLYEDSIASLFELKEAAANVAAGQAAVIDATVELEAASVLAPYDGKVETLFVEERVFPAKGKELIEIIEDGVLLAKFLAPAALMKQLRIGSSLSITLDETNEVVTAKISRVGAIIDPLSGTIRVEAEINNDTRQLKPGMSGMATLIQEAA